MYNSPLGHLRVVDLTDLRGAIAGRLLADLGADVVKIEPEHPDADEMASDIIWKAPKKTAPWQIARLFADKANNLAYGAAKATKSGD